jgi:hypothetical protein
MDPLALDHWVDVLERGANLLYSGPRVRGFKLPNSKAAREHPEVVQAATDKDVAAGFAVPYAQSPQFDTLFVSPLGLQEKFVVPPSPPAWRPINDWSMDNPFDSSINADTDVTVDVFDVFDVVAGRFIRAGPGCWFFKTDFDAAFRRVRVRAQDLHLGGFCARGRGFSLLLRLCFGGRASVHIWELVVACFLALLRVGAGIQDMAHWVDDLFRVCLSLAQADATRDAVQLTAIAHGFDLAEPKTAVGQALEFTGILFDSRSMSFSVLPPKRQKAIVLLEGLLAQGAS